MGATRGSDSVRDKSVGFRVTEEENEEFMQALRKAQSEGLVPIDAERSEALRMLMKAFVNDPSIIEKAGEE